jgi:hypothetical protein
LIAAKAHMQQQQQAGFPILTAGTMKISVFWEKPAALTFTVEKQPQNIR